MTPTEISAAYAALHERWPELRPTTVAWESPNRTGQWVAQPDLDDIRVDDDLAHAACFLACMKACAERSIDVKLSETDNTRICQGDVNLLIVVDRDNPHTITKAIDGYLMQLPKVSQ